MAAPAQKPPVIGPGFVEPDGRQGLVTLSARIHPPLLEERKRQYAVVRNGQAVPTYAAPDHLNGVTEGGLCFKMVEKGPGSQSRRSVTTPLPAIWEDWSNLPIHNTAPVEFMGLAMMHTTPGLGPKTDLVSLQVRGSGPCLGCVPSPIYAGQQVIWAEPEIIGDPGSMRNRVTLLSHEGDHVIRATLLPASDLKWELGDPDIPGALQVSPVYTKLLTIKTELESRGAGARRGQAQGRAGQRAGMTDDELEALLGVKTAGGPNFNERAFIALGVAFARFLDQRIIGTAMKNCNPGELLLLNLH